MPRVCARSCRARAAVAHRWQLRASPASHAFRWKTAARAGSGRPVAIRRLVRGRERAAALDRGYLRATQRDFEPALVDSNKAVELAPDHASYWGRGRVYGLRALTDKTHGSYARAAVADFTRAIDLDPSDSQAYTARGVAYALDGEFERGVSDCRNAVALEPRSAFNHCQCGFVYNLARSFDAAIGEFTEGLRIDPEFASCYEGRAFARRAKGATEGARSDDEVAKRLGPTW